MRRLRRILIPFLSGVAVGAGALWFSLFGPLVFPGTATVIDGDNLRIAGYNVRLAGLDAPELPVVNGRQCRKHNIENGCYDEASVALADFVESKIVFCLLAGFDRRNWRPVVICQTSGIQINKWLIKNCYADPPNEPAHRIACYDELFATRKCQKS